MLFRSRETTCFTHAPEQGPKFFDIFKYFNNQKIHYQRFMNPLLCQEIFCTEIDVKEDDRYCMNQGRTRFFWRQKYRMIYQIWYTVYQDK